MSRSKVALITGGTSGIGEACLRELSEEYKIIFIGRREELGKNIEKEMNEAGKEVEYYKMDVTEDKSIEELYSYVNEKYKRLDLLVNDAGIVTYKTCDELTTEVC